MTPMTPPKRPVPVGVRRTLAAVAITAVSIAGWHLGTNNPTPGIGVLGFSAIQTAAADPTGPPGPTAGPGMDGGQMFQPPQMPAQQPDYQGGNQPPLDQSNGVSIYNSGAPQAPQQPGSQQAGQQPQQGWQTPQHGSQPPDYQTATPYTQGPGRENPDYQAPQQQSPQQGQQPQQQQQPNQQQQPQNKQDDTTQQLNENQQNQQQKCDALASAWSIPMALSGSAPQGSSFGGIRVLGRDPGGVSVPGTGGSCNGYCNQGAMNNLPVQPGSANQPVVDRSLFGQPDPNSSVPSGKKDTFMYCVAALTWVLGSTFFVVGKLVKIKAAIEGLGGIAEAANLLIQAGTTAEKAAALTEAGTMTMNLASDILGVKTIQTNCGGG